MPTSSIDGGREGEREEGFHYEQHKHALWGEAGGARANASGYRQYLCN